MITSNSLTSFSLLEDLQKLGSLSTELVWLKQSLLDLRYKYGSSIIDTLSPYEGASNIEAVVSMFSGTATFKCSCTLGALIDWFQDYPVGTIVMGVKV